jgi:hypothetical protein
MHEWAAQQSSVDAGNLQEQANANNGTRLDNINIAEEEEGLDDDEEEEEDNNSFRAWMQRKQRQQITSKIRQLQEDNVVQKNDELELDQAAAKELVEAKIVIAQTLMDLHEKDALEAAASFVLQAQKLSEDYHLGDFGYLFGQNASIPLERMDEHGRMNYRLAIEDAQSKRNPDDNAWWDPPNADDEKDHFGFGSCNLEKQFSGQNQQMKTMELKRKNCTLRISWNHCVLPLSHLKLP